jgi:hypothetical protein
MTMCKARAGEQNPGRGDEAMSCVQERQFCMHCGVAWQVVCEETPEPYAYGSRSKPKERYVGGIVTPASPNYVHGLVDITGAAPLATPPPLLGIAASVTGYQARLC